MSGSYEELQSSFPSSYCTGTRLLRLLELLDYSCKVLSGSFKNRNKKPEKTCMYMRVYIY